MKANKKFNKFSERLLDIVYPWRCIICAGTAKGKSICDQCTSYLPWCSSCSSCTVCALPLENNKNASLICGHCQKQPPFYDQIEAVFWYEQPIDHLITEYKYFNRWENARTLVELSDVSFVENCLNSVIVPVPSHPARVKQRGFNAVHELIKLFKKRHFFEYDDKLVSRIKNTKSQTGKSKSERRKNVKNAFQINKAMSIEHVTIFDEVVTTDATVNELSRNLKKAGVPKVSVWAIARTRDKIFR